MSVKGRVRSKQHYGSRSFEGKGSFNVWGDCDLCRPIAQVSDLIIKKYELRNDQQDKCA